MLKRILSTWSLYVSLAMVISIDVNAGNADEEALNRGMESLYSEHYELAMKTFLELAEKGNSEAQTQIGEMYNSGAGVPNDGVQALKWLKLAANQGHLWACYKVGEIYTNGQKGVPQNFGEALKWFRLAAEANDQGDKHRKSTIDVARQGLIARYYFGGEGVQQSDSEALKWVDGTDVWRSDIQGLVGSIYVRNKGVQPDFVKAAKWFALGAKGDKAGGDSFSQYNLAVLYSNGQGVAQDYAQAEKWFSAAAAGGYDGAAEAAATARRKLAVAQLEVQFPNNPNVQRLLTKGGQLKAPIDLLLANITKKAFSRDESEYRDFTATSLKQLAPSPADKANGISQKWALILTWLARGSPVNDWADVSGCFYLIERGSAWQTKSANPYVHGEDSWCPSK